MNCQFLRALPMQNISRFPHNKSSMTTSLRENGGFFCAAHPHSPAGRSYVHLKPVIDLENHHPISQEQKPTACPLPWERGKRTRRSIVTIGRRTELVEVVRSVTMQAWDKSWTCAGISASLAVGRFNLFRAPPVHGLPSKPLSRLPQGGEAMCSSNQS